MQVSLINKHDMQHFKVFYRNTFWNHKTRRI